VLKCFRLRQRYLVILTKTWYFIIPGTDGLVVTIRYRKQLHNRKHETPYRIR